ncbi:MAG: hypothetical protein MUE55_07215, partial [Thermoplasmata archaeon]|nr:hypothetical protein [Thermoplasmata archaeon]
HRDVIGRKVRFMTDLYKRYDENISFRPLPSELPSMDEMDIMLLHEPSSQLGTRMAEVLRDLTSVREGIVSGL